MGVGERVSKYGMKGENGGGTYSGGSKNAIGILA